MTTSMWIGFFGWSFVINFAFLLFWSVMIRFASSFVYKIHSSWVPIPIEAFYSAHYSLMGFYKLAIILFNVVPYFALRIIV